MRRIDEVESEEDLSFDAIVKNTWKNAIGGWSLGKKEEKKGSSDDFKLSGKKTFDIKSRSKTGLH